MVARGICVFRRCGSRANDVRNGSPVAQRPVGAQCRAAYDARCDCPSLPHAPSLSLACPTPLTTRVLMRAVTRRTGEGRRGNERRGEQPQQQPQPQPLSIGPRSTTRCCCCWPQREERSRKIQQECINAGNNTQRCTGHKSGPVIQGGNEEEEEEAEEEQSTHARLLEEQRFTRLLKGKSSALTF